MKKLFIAMAVLLLLCGCEKSAEMPAEISDTSQTAEVTEKVSETEVTMAAEKVTAAKTESTTVTTEETVPLTPLEEMRKQAETESSFLYDITGDNFPELFEFGFYGDESVLFASSAIYKWDYIISCNDRIYVCRDDDGKIFLASGDTDYFMAGYTPYTAVRYDFFSNDIRTTYIASVQEYTYPWWEEGGNSYYIYESDVFPDYDGAIDHTTVQKLLEEYVSGYELLDVIEFKAAENRTEVSFGAGTDFSENYTDDLPEYENTSEKITINGEIYESDITNIVFRPHQIEGDFDFDILNKFEKLCDIDFVNENPLEEKAKIKTGEWCKKIKYLQVNVSAYDTVNTDFSAFENVEAININGRMTRENMEFIKDMPNIKIIDTFCIAESPDAFVPISELPNLEAIIDSGQGSCMEKLSYEEQERVMELLPRDKYFWGMVK